MPVLLRATLWALALSAGSLPACTDHRTGSPRPTGRAPSVPAALVHHTVRASDTDPAIHTPDDDHLACVAQGGPHNGKLLVFLPGTNGRPGNTTLFLEEAARAGYHAVGLAYPDEDSANQVCQDDLDCYDRMRHEVWDGTDASPTVEVTPAESIKNRLIKLLLSLHRSHPDEGWDAFLAGKDLRYDTLALAGLSQGGGHAAYIAKIHRVARVIMFSSVCDADRSHPPRAATWVSSPHATPAERYYGFDHTDDPFAEKIRSTWPALGLDRLGPRTSVDDARPPYGGSHQLVTSIPQPGPKKAHTSVVADGTTPTRQGAPLYREVWRYMLGD